MQTQTIPVVVQPGAAKAAASATSATGATAGQQGVQPRPGTTAASVFAMLLAAQGGVQTAHGGQVAGAQGGKPAQGQQNGTVITFPGQATAEGEAVDPAAAQAELQAAMTPGANAQGTVTNLTLAAPETTTPEPEIAVDAEAGEADAAGLAGDAVAAATDGPAQPKPAKPAEGGVQPAQSQAGGATPNIAAATQQATAGTPQAPDQQATTQAAPQVQPADTAPRVQPTSFAEALQSTGTPASTHGITQPAQTSHAQAAPLAQHAAATPQPAAQQIAVHLTRAVKDGMDRIEIQLNPAELGKVDIKLEVGHDGRVTAVISADRAETLDILRRDVHQFEKAIANAGLDANRDNFTFAERRDRDGRPGSAGGPDNPGEVPVEDVAPRETYPAGRRIALDRPGVDMTV